MRTIRQVVMQTGMRTTAALLAALTLAGPALAADGQRLYANCAACHGTAGRSASAVLAPLAGQKKDALIASMRAFKDGSRPATIMHQIAKGYSDEQIAQIAAWLAALPAAPAGAKP